MLKRALILAIFPCAAFAQPVAQPSPESALQACQGDLAQQSNASLYWHALLIEAEHKVASLPPDLQQQIKDKLNPKPPAAPTPSEGK